ncbi:7360_t:CDS:1, partial [Scutellospora calospora]
PESLNKNINTENHSNMLLEKAFIEQQINLIEYTEFSKIDKINESNSYKYQWKKLTVVLKALEIETKFDQKTIQDFVKE